MLRWVHRSSTGALSLCMIMLLMSAAFATDSELEQRKLELDELQGKIQAVDRLIARFEAERQAEATELAKAERAVSAASRELREIEERRQQAEVLVAEHERGAVALSLRIEEQRHELAQWLRRQYMHGGNDAAPVFAGRDPNQLARDLRYMGFLSEARAELILSLRQDHASRAELLSAASDERQRLDALQVEKRNQQEKLEQIRHARSRAVAQIAASVREQQQQAELMRRSEAQLSEVVEALSRAAEARERFRQLAAERAQAATPTIASVPPARQQRAEVRRRVPAASGKPFAELRGKLGLPVAGELIGRFGTQRASTGTRWRGTFIRASEGEHVLAVASGDVVFSDWLRGYGNLIIVDHGHDYLSIYGNNDALLGQVGERVEAGKPIATVGSAGWIQDSGLYFEIRHKGEPLDPAQWIARR